MQMKWASDALAALLREMDFKYVALNPGASYRGLHDSIVNFLGNENPEMLLCLHEEHAIAIAHGWAKVTNTPLLCAVHSQVGLMHATMAMYVAWVDRIPMVVLGANGPLDAAKRRPFRDWVHTSADNGALVRHYTKWDDQPHSIEAALVSLLRANQMARALPGGPTYVAFDVEMQEEEIDPALPLPDLARFAPPHPPVPTPADVQQVATLLRRAERPVILVGRVSRSLDGWEQRIALAEALGARVVTDLKVGAGFPTDHPLHVSPPGGKLTRPQIEAVRAADAVLNLDFVDLGGTLLQAYDGKPPTATVISCSLDQYVHNGWSMDYQELPAVDLNLAGDPDTFVPLLLAALGVTVPAKPSYTPVRRAPAALPNAEHINLTRLSATVAETFAAEETCFIRLKSSSDCPFTFRHPLDYLGGSTGVGIGPGIAVGAALALRGSSRLPVVVLGDGDFLMGGTAFWTAAASRIPLLVIVANNRSFYNDEVHQEHVARHRGRPVERKWIGQRIDDPPPDLAGFARVQGGVGIGPVTRADELADALRRAIAEVRAGKLCVVDVIVQPEAADGRG
jgi:thiamine pyrophosphate-dependent acetolactate synthase large subunit-like protein